MSGNEFKQYCARCGDLFVARQRSARYCSKPCWNSAYRGLRRKVRRRYDGRALLDRLGFEDRLTKYVAEDLGTTKRGVTMIAHEGLSREYAEKYAIKAGFHPYDLWPDMAEHDRADAQLHCNQCGALYDAEDSRGRLSLSRRRFCSVSCAKNHWLRWKMKLNPKFRESRREWHRQYRAQYTDGLNKAKRQWYRLNADRARLDQRRRQHSADLADKGWAAMWCVPVTEAVVRGHADAILCERGPKTGARIIGRAMAEARKRAKGETP